MQRLIPLHEAAHPLSAGVSLGRFRQRHTLLLPAGMPPERVEALAERYSIEEAWLTPTDGLGWGMDEPALVLIDSLSDSSTSP